MKYENIDNIFKSKLEKREIKPSQNAWDKLEKMLDEKNRTKTPVWNWKLLSGIAASITFLILSVLGLWQFSHPDKNNLPIVTKEQNKKNDDSVDINTLKEATSDKNKLPNIDENKLTENSSNKKSKIPVDENKIQNQSKTVFSSPSEESQKMASNQEIKSDKQPQQIPMNGFTNTIQPVKEKKKISVNASNLLHHADQELNEVNLTERTKTHMEKEENKTKNMVSK